MNFKDFLKIGQNFLLFNKSTLRTLEKSPEVLNANIKYWLKQKRIIGLKNGMYVLEDRYRQADNKDAYCEYIANQLIMPSYLSTEYVLAKYRILSEPVNAFTSVTTKTSREITNDLGCFRYYSLSQKIFTGYSVKYYQGAPIYEAEKPKALFDFLYLRFLSRRPINAESLNNLRLNWENISVADFKRAKRYAMLSSSSRMATLFALIKKQYYD
ncbi:MAG: hypothetical protein WC846_05240 [Candidatus Gracilibacteria bacterium]|jgi:hypothetical protein